MACDTAATSHVRVRVPARERVPRLVVAARALRGSKRRHNAEPGATCDVSGPKTRAVQAG